MASGPWMEMPAEKPWIARPRMTLCADSMVRPGKSAGTLVSLPSMPTRTWALNPTANAFGTDKIPALTGSIATSGGAPPCKPCRFVPSAVSS